MKMAGGIYPAPHSETASGGAGRIYSSVTKPTLEILSRRLNESPGSGLSNGNNSTGGVYPHCGHEKKLCLTSWRNELAKRHGRFMNSVTRGSRPKPAGVARKRGRRRRTHSGTSRRTNENDPAGREQWTPQ